MTKQRVPGVDAPSRTDLPVLLPLDERRTTLDPVGFSRWLAGVPVWVLIVPLLLITVWPSWVLAQSGYSYGQAVAAFFKWMPLLITDGFLFNVVISVLTMAIGTAAGVLLGLAQISLFAPVRILAKFLTQAFRNSPWLVLLFIVLLALPFEIEIGSTVISIPDWIKAVFGLSLPIMANISEVVRGAVNSVPTGQWEAADSLAYSRTQTLGRSSCRSATNE